MTKQDLLTGIVAFLIAWLVVPLFVPFDLSAPLLAAILIVAIVILRTLDTPPHHTLSVIIGFIIGLIVALLIPPLKSSGVGGWSLMWSAGLGVLLALQI